MGNQSHWNSIYKAKAADEVSWYQEHPTKSLEFIHATGLSKEAEIIDVGGGASTLVDHLMADGFKRITVLDISSEGLRKSKARLGDRAKGISWIEGDVTEGILPRHVYDVWHDRAVFHFLTAAEDRRKYMSAMSEALKPGGSAIIATFALDGPPRCSGLDVVRYSPQSLHAELGREFRLIESDTETHHTPFDTEQKFLYCLFQKSSEK